MPSETPQRRDGIGIKYHTDGKLLNFPGQDIPVNGHRLNTVFKSTYLNITPSQNATIDEVNVLIARDSSAFGRLYANVWNRRGITAKSSLKDFLSSFHHSSSSFHLSTSFPSFPSLFFHSFQLPSSSRFPHSLSPFPQSSFSSFTILILSSRFNLTIFLPFRSVSFLSFHTTFFSLVSTPSFSFPQYSFSRFLIHPFLFSSVLFLPFPTLVSSSFPLSFSFLSHLSPRFSLPPSFSPSSLFSSSFAPIPSLALFLVLPSLPFPPSLFRLPRFRHSLLLSSVTSFLLVSPDLFPFFLSTSFSLVFPIPPSLFPQSILPSFPYLCFLLVSPPPHFLLSLSTLSSFPSSSSCFLKSSFSFPYALFLLVSYSFSSFPSQSSLSLLLFPPLPPHSLLLFPQSSFLLFPSLFSYSFAPVSFLPFYLFSSLSLFSPSFPHHSSFHPSDQSLFLLVSSQSFPPFPQFTSFSSDRSISSFLICLSSQSFPPSFSPIMSSSSLVSLLPPSPFPSVSFLLVSPHPPSLFPSPLLLSSSCFPLVFPYPSCLLSLSHSFLLVSHNFFLLRFQLTRLLILFPSVLLSSRFLLPSSLFSSVLLSPRFTNSFFLSLVSYPFFFSFLISSSFPHPLPPFPYSSSSHRFLTPSSLLSLSHSFPPLVSPILFLDFITPSSLSSFSLLLLPPFPSVILSFIVSLSSFLPFPSVLFLLVFP
ncbi:hypothetical protein C7M84_010356 [Penaeus vannamei]|uniref:Uncharacterized protein n=1 Tax=Penaeus vannamei TaxID=6689 RepID=A0A423UA86_PENVA|nr:hypothetical protein C7M84_010356 [Penaeus vannamei]